MLRLCLPPTEAGVAGTREDSHVTNTRSAPRPRRAAAPLGEARQPIAQGGQTGGNRSWGARPGGGPPGPGAAQPPVTCKRQGAEGARFSGQPPASRARPAGTLGLGFQSPRVPAGRLLGSPQRGGRDPGSGQTLSASRARAYLTATRTELSSGAPHMPAASDSRLPGPLHRRTDAPLQPRRWRSGGWSCRGRSAHLRRTPAMLGD